ncbi:MAG: TlpA family protein disulfide reductase, partial [Oligoflexia bacterium]|nr:TlpA family protein disulfide reductase [Oligoflexia bacterium]
MKKTKLFPLLKAIFLLLLVPAIFFFWRIVGEESVIGFIKPPVSVNAVKVGTIAPDVIVPKELHWKRTPFQLSEHKSKAIFVHFWATWCGPCLSELPELLSMADKWKQEGIILIAVAVDQSWYQVE